MEAAKNGIFIVTRPLRGGDGVRAGPLRKKKVFEALKRIWKARGEEGMLRPQWPGH